MSRRAAKSRKAFWLLGPSPVHFACHATKTDQFSLSFESQIGSGFSLVAFDFNNEPRRVPVTGSVIPLRRALLLLGIACAQTIENAGIVIALEVVGFSVVPVFVPKQTHP